MAPVRAPFNSQSQTPQTSRSQNLNSLADDSKSDESPTGEGRPASAPLMFNNNPGFNPNSRPRRARAKWNSRMEEAMLDALIEAQSKGLQTEATYKPAGWQMALDAVQKIASYPVELRQIKSKHDTHKKDWKIWRDFCSQSAFNWDTEKGIPTGPPQVLDAYLEAHPEARKFRESPLAFSDKLALLLDNHRATGRHASSLNQILQDLDKDEEEVEALGAPGALGGADSPGSPCESIEISENSSDSTAGSQPSRSPTPNHAKTPRAKSTLALRKRSLENATKAELKRQKKTGARHLADALQDVVQELKTSCDLLVEANKTPAEKVAEILVSEFGELDEVQQDIVFTAIQSSERISLFLARSKDMRRRWVQRILDEIEPNSQETPGHT